jgi:hypothetical protein
VDLISSSLTPRFSAMMAFTFCSMFADMVSPPPLTPIR